MTIPNSLEIIEPVTHSNKCKSKFHLKEMSVSSIMPASRESDVCSYISTDIDNGNGESVIDDNHADVNNSNRTRTQHRRSQNHQLQVFTVNGNIESTQLNWAQVNRNNTVILSEINGNNPVCPPQTNRNSNEAELTDINGNNEVGLTLIRNNKTGSGNTNGENDTGSAETRASNQLTRLEAADISNQTEFVEINGNLETVSRQNNEKNSVRSISENNSTRTEQVSDRFNVKRLLDERERHKEEKNEACVTNSRKAGTTAASLIKRNSRGQFISRQPNARESGSKPHFRRVLFSSDTGSELRPNHQNSVDELTTKNGCSDAKKQKMTNKLEDATKMSHQEQNQLQSGGHGINKNQKSRRYNDVTVNSKSRGFCDDGEIQHDGLHEASNKTTKSVSEEATGHLDKYATAASTSRDTEIRSINMTINKLCGQRGLHDNKTRTNSPAHTVDVVKRKEESTQSAKLERQTSEGNIPDSETLPLFEKLPVTSCVNYIPFWLNLHLNDSELDYISRNYCSADELLERAGPYVHTLTIQSSMWRPVNIRMKTLTHLIPRFCSNIKELTIGFSRLPAETLAEIVKINSLQKVHIQRLFVKNLRSLITCLLPAEDLRELKISLRDEIEIDLEEQNIGGLIVAMTEFFRRNRHLQAFTFTSIVNTEMVKTILENCPNLERLELNVCKAKEHLQPCAFDIHHPNLKALVIRSKVKVMTGCWLAIFLSSFPSLEKLELWGVLSDCVSNHLPQECLGKFGTNFKIKGS